MNQRTEDKQSRRCKEESVLDCSFPSCMCGPKGAALAVPPTLTTGETPKRIEPQYLSGSVSGLWVKEWQDRADQLQRDLAEAVETTRMAQERASLSSTGAPEQEGFYEKLWKDFCSLQRGDAAGICERVERYYREQAALPSASKDAPGPHSP